MIVKISVFLSSQNKTYSPDSSGYLWGGGSSAGSPSTAGRATSGRGSPYTGSWSGRSRSWRCGGAGGLGRSVQRNHIRGGHDLHALAYNPCT